MIVVTLVTNSANANDEFGNTSVLDDSLLETELGTELLSFDSHVDDFRARGGDEEMPWHFHTGRGLLIETIHGPNGEILQQIRANCELSYDNPDCMEKVFFFTEDEILGFVQAAVSAYESDLRTHQVGIAFSTAVVVWSGKVFLAGMVAPDPTVVTSKIVAVGAGLVAGVMAIVAAWEGKRIYEIHQTMAKIEELLAEERRYVNRCGHLSRNFLDRLAKLGVTIRFLKNGYDLISGHHYLDSIKREEELSERARTYARAKRMRYGDAYDAVFRDACGQVAVAKRRGYTSKHPWRRFLPAEKRRDPALVQEELRELGFFPIQ